MRTPVNGWQIALAVMLLGISLLGMGTNITDNLIITAVSVSCLAVGGYIMRTK